MYPAWFGFELESRWLHNGLFLQHSLNEGIDFHIHLMEVPSIFSMSAYGVSMVFFLAMGTMVLLLTMSCITLCNKLGFVMLNKAIIVLFYLVDPSEAINGHIVGGEKTHLRSHLMLSDLVSLHPLVSLKDDNGLV